MGSTVNAPPLPAGFVLDEQSDVTTRGKRRVLTSTTPQSESPELPPLPPGFILDEPSRSIVKPTATTTTTTTQQSTSQPTPQSQSQQEVLTSSPLSWGQRFNQFIGLPVNDQNTAAARVLDAAEGVTSGLFKTAVYGGDLIRRATGMERIIDKPEVQQLMRTPESLTGSAGNAFERIAEFAVPMTGVAKAMKGAKLIPTMLTEAGTGATVAGLQEGGDPVAMTTAAIGGAVIPGAGAGLAKTGQVVKRMAEGAQEGGVGGAAARMIRSATTMDPVDTLFRALKPRSTRVNFRDSLQAALPELKASERLLGKPIETTEELLDAAKLAKKRIWEEREKVLGPAREMGAQVDLSTVADAIQNSIPARTRLLDPGKAAAILNDAGTYRRKVDLRQAEELLKNANDELESFYNKYPMGQRAAMASDPAIAPVVQEAKALRDAIETSLASIGGPEARELGKRYGQLMEVEDAVFRRLNPAGRQQYEGLSEQMAGWSAIGDIARGAWAVSRGDIRGLADITAGHAKREAAKYLKDEQSTANLIRRALENTPDVPPVYPAAPVTQIKGLLEKSPFRMGPVEDTTSMTVISEPWPKPRIAGLLEKAPLKTPPPTDTSGITVTSEPWPAPRIKGLLEKAPLFTPTPPDTSIVRGVPAKSIVVRDPKTGRMKRVYTSEPKP